MGRIRGSSVFSRSFRGRRAKNSRFRCLAIRMATVTSSRFVCPGFYRAIVGKPRRETPVHARRVVLPSLGSLSLADLPAQDQGRRFPHSLSIPDSSQITVIPSKLRAFRIRVAYAGNYRNSRAKNNFVVSLGEHRRDFVYTSSYFLPEQRETRTKNS